MYNLNWIKLTGRKCYNKTFNKHCYNLNSHHYENKSWKQLAIEICNILIDTTKDRLEYTKHLTAVISSWKIPHVYEGISYLITSVYGVRFIVTRFSTKIDWKLN